MILGITFIFAVLLGLMVAIGIALAAIAHEKSLDEDGD